MPCDATTVDGIKDYVVQNLNARFYAVYNPDAQSVRFNEKAGTNPMLSLELTRLMPDAFGFGCCSGRLVIVGEDRIGKLKEAGINIDEKHTRAHIDR